MPTLQEIASQIRRDILRMVHGAASGHPGGSLGCADFVTALYFKIMKRKEGFDMDAWEEDIFILSNGHISPLLYSALARSGYLNRPNWLRFVSWTAACRVTLLPTKGYPVCG